MDEFVTLVESFAKHAKEEADRIADKLKLLRAQVLDLECDLGNVLAQRKALMDYISAREGEAAQELNMTASQILDRRGM